MTEIVREFVCKEIESSGFSCKLSSHPKRNNNPMDIENLFKVCILIFLKFKKINLFSTSANFIKVSKSFFELSMR